MLSHIPAIMPCITTEKKTLQFAQLAIGSIYRKANILTILAHTVTRKQFHAKFRYLIFKFIETTTDLENNL